VGEATVCTCTVRANLGPWVPGPQLPMQSPVPGSLGPLNIVSCDIQPITQWYLSHLIDVDKKKGEGPEPSPVEHQK